MRYTKDNLEHLVKSGNIRGYGSAVATKQDPGPNKYRNKKTFAADGFEFDSKKEYVRYLDLKAMQEAGTITDLRRQQEFNLIVNDQLICSYVADFSYLRNGSLTVEDTKSKITRKLPVYRIKRKLMYALNGIDVKEV